MKQYKIEAHFRKGYLVSTQINLVTEDYKSTEFIFEFDMEEGRKVFELKKPDGSKYIKDIINNKITLVDYDTELNEISLIPTAGTYEFEIVNYTEDSKLTLQEHGHFEVRGEIVEVNDSEVEKDTRLPILDSLINDVEGLKTDINSSVKNATEQANYAKEQGNYAKEQASMIVDANEQATELIKDFEQKTDSYINDFDLNSESKENSYNDNATTKLSEYNTNSETKTKAFNTNASEKTDAFNLNATKKTTYFNSNAEAKTTEFNDNATTKTEEYNTNAESKVNEFNAVVDELKQDVEDCYNNMLTNEVEGTSIHIEDSANARIISLETDGNSEQASTKGNQLLNIPDVTKSLSGMTLTVTNGVGKVTGTPTENTLVYFWGSYSGNTSILTLEPGTYTLSSGISFEQYDGTNRNTYKDTFTLDSTTTFTGLRRTSVYTANTAYNETWEPMLSLGDTILPYEPYTGGQPSPNLDYPQEFEVIEAYNLFNKDNVNVLNAYIDSSSGTINTTTYGKSLYLEIPNNTKNITVSRIAGQRFCIGTTDTLPSVGSTCLNCVGNNTSSSITIPILPESKYLIVYYYNAGYDTLTEQEILDSIQIVKGSEVKPYAPYGYIENKFIGKNLFNKELIKFYANNFSAFENTSNVNNTRIRTSSFKLKDNNLKHNVFYEISGLPSGWTLMSVRTYMGTIYLEDTSTYSITGNKFSILSDKVDYIHLLFKNDNSTEIAISDFENSDIQLELGLSTAFEPYQENYLDVNLKTDNLFDGKLELGSFDGNANPSTNSSCLRTVNFTPIKPNTLYSIFNDLRYQSVMQYYDENKNFISSKSFEYSGAFLTPANAKYLKFRSSVGNVENNLNVKYALYEGATNEHGVYFIGKIGDVKDTLRVENGRAILTKRIGKQIFDGSEIWSTNLANNKYSQFFMPFKLALTGKGVCDQFIYSITETNGNKFYISTNIVFVRPIINGSDITTMDEWKQHLSSNPITVYYILTTPYEVDLGEIKMAKTYEGVTNISMIANLESNMKLKYVRSTNIVVDNLAKAIVALGGEINV